MNAKRVHGNITRAFVRKWTSAEQILKNKNNPYTRQVFHLFASSIYFSFFSVNLYPDSHRNQNVIVFKDFIKYI